MIVAPGELPGPDPAGAAAIDVHGVAGRRPAADRPADLGGEFVLQRAARRATSRCAAPRRARTRWSRARPARTSRSSPSTATARRCRPPVPTVLRDSVVVAEEDGSGAAALKLREGSERRRAARPAQRHRASPRGERDPLRGRLEPAGHARQRDRPRRRHRRRRPQRRRGLQCRHSNLRPERLLALALGDGILSAEPLLADPADALPAAARLPDADAGIDDALHGHPTPTAAPADRPGHRRLRVLPAATVARARRYEHARARRDVAPAPPAPPVRGIPAPVLGKTVIVAPGQGKVLVRRPGTRASASSAGARCCRSAPWSTRAAADPPHDRARRRPAGQTGRFWGGRFQIRQGHGAAA